MFETNKPTIDKLTPQQREIVDEAIKQLQQGNVLEEKENNKILPDQEKNEQNTR